MIKLRYLWLDARGHIRNKLKIVDQEEIEFDDIPVWSFDGSSTGQAVTGDSDLFITPVDIYVSEVHDEILVLCTVSDFDDNYHESEKRPQLEALAEQYEDSGWLFGIEQEYVLMDAAGTKLYRWPEGAFPGEQGPYYCGVGYDEAYGAYIIDAHTDACIEYGLAICGTNAEVMPSQWEFQIGAKDPLTVADDLIVARYLLYKTAAEYEATATLHPKPVKGNWNGSGAHTNFSTSAMMNPETGREAIIHAIDGLTATHDECIALYGEDLDHRMTGELETSDPTVFSFGDSDRACSIRKPIGVRKDGYGYLEDRRPCANINPYVVCAAIMQSVEEGRCTIK